MKEIPVTWKWRESRDNSALLVNNRLSHEGPLFKPTVRRFVYLRWCPKNAAYSGTRKGGGAD